VQPVQTTRSKSLIDPLSLFSTELSTGVLKNFCCINLFVARQVLCFPLLTRRTQKLDGSMRSMGRKSRIQVQSEEVSLRRKAEELCLSTELFRSETNWFC
jgi:hypothetical protein